MGNIEIGNWLGQTKSAGAIVKLADTPLEPADDQLPTSTSTVKFLPHDKEVVDNSRHLFKGYPEGYVFKIRGSEEINTLLLKLETELNYGIASAPTPSSDPIIQWGLFSISGPPFFHYQSAFWAGGDEKHYTSVTVYGNLAVPDSDPQEYDVYSSTSAWSPSSGETTTSFSDIYRSASKIGTSANAYIGPTVEGDEGEYYAEFSGLLNYDEDEMPFEGINKHDVFIGPRLESAPGHGLDAYPITSHGLGEDDRLSTYGPVTSLNLEGVYPQSNYTYQGVTSWIPTFHFSKQTVKCSFIYDANQCPSNCWFVGKKVTVKIKYKVATVTRGSLTPLPGGANLAYENTLGAFSDHSEVTKVLILPGGSAGTFEQVTIEGESPTFDMPREAGKVICIDDFYIVSVEPADA
jgi:hypothetical protein